MAEEESNTKHKLTPTEYAVNFNSGAAYASATGDLIGGMGYIFNRSQDLSNEPIIQQTMAGAIAYLNSQNKYSEEMKKWETSDKKTEDNKPKLEQSPELFTAQNHYMQVANSSKVRTEIFNNSYEQLTLNQAKGASLYGKMPRNTPKTIIQLVENNKDKIIKDIKDEKLKKVVDAFKKYHILGNTTKDIQGMYLEKSLEAIANNSEK